MIALCIPLTALALVGPLASAPDLPFRSGSYIPAPPELISAKGGSTSRILFLNRCIGGCSVSPGIEDSRTNHSSILERAIVLSEWIHSDEDWDNMVNCVRGLYTPFDVVVTDTDPGDKEHFEAMVAGTSGEGTFSRALGVSPFNCGVIDNAITFTYASMFDDMREICNVVGQESAHALGLDHQLDCADPLTYLRGCPIKSFQDNDALCGEYVERECTCGGETQNTVQYLLDLFGEGAVPEVVIVSPGALTEVETGFEIKASGSDDHNAIVRSELWIDGQRVESKDVESSTSEFSFDAPKTLSPQEHEIEVRLFDDRNQFGASSITVTQADCQSSSQCEFSYLCLAGQCVLGPQNSGGLGESCQASEDCDGDICATKENEKSVCAAYCDRDPQACPNHFECLATANGNSVCMPEDTTSTGGCSLGGATGFGGKQGKGSALGFLLTLLVLYGTRKQHGKRRHSAPKSGSH